MYDYLLDNKLATLVAALMISWLAFIGLGRRSHVFRSVLYAFGPSFACAFYFVGLSHGGKVSRTDLLAGLLFETVVLFAYLTLFCRALDLVRCAHRSPEAQSVDRWLLFTLMAQLAVGAPTVLTEGFGIFSDGSRIEYLQGNALLKYATYAIVLLGAVQAGLLAYRMSAGRGVGWIGATVVVFGLASSLLSGSKGGVFLWFASVVALLSWNRVRGRRWLVLTGGCVLTAAFAATASIAGDALGLTTFEFSELAFARFFLNNDARALAVDFGGAAVPLREIFASSFRGVSATLGVAPADPPLGPLLNDLQFGITTGEGPNASLMALITYYSPRGYAIFGAVMASLGVWVLWSAAMLALRRLRRPHTRLAVLLVGAQLIVSMSQDFLAFPLLLLSAMALVALLLWLEPRRITFKHVHARPSAA